MEEKLGERGGGGGGRDDLPLTEVRGGSKPYDLNSRSIKQNECRRRRKRTPMVGMLCSL